MNQRYIYAFTLTWGGDEPTADKLLDEHEEAMLEAAREDDAGRRDSLLEAQADED